MGKTIKNKPKTKLSIRKGAFLLHKSIIHNMLTTKWIKHKILLQNLLAYDKPYYIIHHARR